MTQDPTTRAAAVAMRCAMGEPEKNLERVAYWAERARDDGAAFAVFPEECVTGSLNKARMSMTQARAVVERAAAVCIPRLEALCARLNMTLAVGTIEPHGDRFHNSVSIVGPEGFLGSYGKVHLPNRKELEWFVPGDELLVATSRGWTFSVGICADLNYPELFRSVACAGAEFVLLAVGCSGNGTTESAVAGREEYAGLLRSAAVANGLCILYADQVGPDRLGLAFTMNLRGELVDSCCAREGIAMAEIDRAAIRKARSGGDPTNLNRVRPDVYERIRRVGG